MKCICDGFALNQSCSIHSRVDTATQIGLFGTAAYKLARSTDPDSSHEAAERVDTTRLERSVYEVILTFGSDGCISDDIVARFPDSRIVDKGGTITPRYRALLNKNWIFDTGERRRAASGRSQRVLCATKFRRSQ